MSGGEGRGTPCMRAQRHGTGREGTATLSPHSSAAVRAAPAPNITSACKVPCVVWKPAAACWLRPRRCSCSACSLAECIKQPLQVTLSTWKAITSRAEP
jgi:hypothetical protein